MQAEKSQAKAPPARGGVMMRIVCALGMLVLAACGSNSEAQPVAAPAPATITELSRQTDPSTGFAAIGDFERILYVPASVQVTTIGKNNGVQLRAFVSATVFYQPPLPVQDVFHYVGGEVNPQRDLIVMRCQPADPTKLEPILASWPNVLAALATDLGSEFTPADCPAAATDPADRQVYCAALSYTDKPNTTLVTTLAAAVTAGAQVVDITGAPSPTGSTTGADVLFDLYGIGSGFSGLGFAVNNSFTGGKPALLNAAQALEQSVVPEYLVDNVSLAAGGCHCIRVPPYPSRDQSPLDMDQVDQLGGLGSCTTLSEVPS